MVAIACGSGGQPAANVAPSPNLASSPAPQPLQTETPTPSPPTPTPTPGPERFPDSPRVLLPGVTRTQLADRGFEVAEIPVEIVQGITELNVEEHEALWSQFLTNTRVEYDSSGTEVLLCEGGRATAVRNLRFFELVDQPLTWEISRSPATRGSDVTLKLTPLDPDLAANRLFYGSYNTASYTVSVDFQEGFVRFLVDARDARETFSPTETIIVRDPGCSSHLPG